MGVATRDGLRQSGEAPLTGRERPPPASCFALRSRAWRTSWRSTSSNGRSGELTWQGPDGGLDGAAFGSSRALRVTMQKLDPYINVDPRTTNLYQAL